MRRPEKNILITVSAVLVSPWDKQSQTIKITHAFQQIIFFSAKGGEAEREDKDK